MFEVDKSEFARALAVIAHVAPKRATVPILQGVSITASGDRLLLVGTNLDCSIAVTLPCRAHRTVTAVGDLKHLIASLKTLPDGQVTVEHDRNGTNILRVRRDRGYFASPCPGDQADYPEMFRDTVTEVGSLDADLLTTLTERVAPFTDKLAGYTGLLNQVCVTSGDKSIDFGATDGSRMSWHCGQPNTFGYTFKALLPGDAVKTLAKLKLKTATMAVDTFAAEHDRTAVLAEFTGTGKGAHVRLRFKCGYGEYPRYQELYPETLSGYREFKREELLAAAKAVVASSPKADPHKMLVIRGTDIGNKDGTLMAAVSDARASDCEPVALNAQFLAEWLSATSQPVITLQVDHLKPASKPVVMQAGSTKHLVMPLSLKTFDKKSHKWVDDIGWWSPKQAVKALPGTRGTARSASTTRQNRHTTGSTP